MRITTTIRLTNEELLEFVTEKMHEKFRYQIHHPCYLGHATSLTPLDNGNGFSVTWEEEEPVTEPATLVETPCCGQS